MLEEYIKDKARKRLAEKLANIAGSFSELVPHCTVRESVRESSSYDDHAHAHGSNILTDCFGHDFPIGVSHRSPFEAAKEYVPLLMLAFELCPYNMKDRLEDLKESKLKTISRQIMEQMESAVQDEPETSVTIKGRGIKIEGE